MVFSVIVTVHNRDAFLAKCLNSILINPSGNYEVILVDDGSTDNSGEICDKYVSQYEHVRCIHTDNQGVANARNVALKLAIGEYVLFVDDDDEWDTSFSLTQIKKNILSSRTDLVVFGMILHHIDATPSFDQFVKAKEMVINDWREHQHLFLNQFPNGIMFSCCNKVFKRIVIQENHITFVQQQMEDFRFVLEYLNAIKGVTFLSTCPYIYCKRPNIDSLTKSVRKNMLDDYNQCHKMLLSLFDDKYATDIHQIMAPQYIGTINRYLRQLDVLLYKEDAKKQLDRINRNKLAQLAISSFHTHTLSEKITYYLICHGQYMLLRCYRKITNFVKYT